MAESAFVSCMSAHSLLNLITATIVWIGIIEHRTRQIVELSVGKLHSVLVHARTHDVLQLFVLNQAVAIQIVDFEEKFDFVLGRLARELVHGVDELLQRDGARVVFVEDLEDTFVEEWLEIKVKLGFCSKIEQISCSQKFASKSLTFFEMTIFLKSSRLISFPSPTVFLKSCSNRSSDVLSKPVFGRVLVRLEMHSITCVVDTALLPSVSEANN